MTISLHLHDIRDHDRIRARDSGLRLEVIHRERQGMTDRIQKSFETWAQQQGFKDLTQHMGRYNRAVVRWMWEAWQEQSERVADMAAALERSHRRSTDLLKQCRDHDTRRAAAVAQAASLAAEVERLNAIISHLSVEGQDAVEM